MVHQNDVKALYRIVNNPKYKNIPQKQKRPVWKEAVKQVDKAFGEKMRMVEAAIKRNAPADAYIAIKSCVDAGIPSNDEFITTAKKQADEMRRANDAQINKANKEAYQEQLRYEATEKLHKAALAYSFFDSY